MISYFAFYLYSFAVMLPVIVWDIYYRTAGVWTLICLLIWTFLLAIKFTPTGALIPQYISFCKCRLCTPEDFLPKMDFEQIKSLVSIKELKADFDYVSIDYDKKCTYIESYHTPLDKDIFGAFIICLVKDDEGNEIYVNPTTYFDYFRMCCLIKRRGASICTENAVDAQLENLTAIRNVLRNIQDEEIAKMQDVASKNKEIENRILSDREVMIKAK